MNTRAASGTPSRRKRNKSVAVFGALALAIACYPRSAVAGDGFSFALHLQRFTQVLRVDQAHVDTINERIGIEIWETAQSNLLLGVTLGQLFITQRDYPTASGDDFNGFYGELSITHPVVNLGVFELAATASYGYNQVASPTSENEIHFHTLSAEGNARLALTNTLKLISTVSYGTLRGDEVTRLPTDHRNLKETQRTGVALGLELNVDAGGYVTLRADDGARSGMSLNFSRKY